MERGCWWSSPLNRSALLGTLVAPALAVNELVLFVAFAMYLVGAMLYMLFITLILYRWMFFSMPAETLMPTYWINMGALAITTLAGSRLLLVADTWTLLHELRPFLKGFTLFFWATGTWWIPLLVIVGIWRHVWERVPLTYDPQYWGLVFPLGMYTIATLMLASSPFSPGVAGAGFSLRVGGGGWGVGARPAGALGGGGEPNSQGRRGPAGQGRGGAGAQRGGGPPPPSHSLASCRSGVSNPSVNQL